MKDKLYDLEQFFNYNLQIKQMLSFYPEIYSKEDAIEYVDKTYKNLQDIKYMLIKMITIIDQDEKIIQYINKLFAYYEKVLLNSHYNPQKLREFYRNCLSNMDPTLIHEINKEIKGYYLFNDYHSFFYQSKTINELIHVLHQYITNNETFYQKIPIDSQKTNQYEGTITLYGHNTPIANAIYINMDHINSSIIDILSLNNNHILMMARDLGHALTIEIEIEKEKAHVKHFIPKVCNIDMVNHLKGITPIKANENSDIGNLYAKGSFEINTEDLIPNLLELMTNVPKDEDMFIKGGTLNNKAL